MRECYAADRRAFRLTDYRKVEDRLVIEGRERLVTGELPRIGLFGGRAEKLASKAGLAAGDAELLYGTFFLSGGADEPVAAPLVLFPAELNDAVELSVDLGAPRINDSLLEMFLDDREARERLAGVLSAEATDGFDGASSLATLADAVQKEVRTGTEELSVFPALAEERLVRSHVDSANTRALPFSVLMLVRRSPSTRGVLHELESLENADKRSAPLDQVLTGQRSPTETRASPLGPIPVVLSERQRAIASHATAQALTLAIGPPGTGKSFTATAVALEHIARGQTVLLSAQTDQALDVLEDMLVGFLGSAEPVMRAGRGDQRRVLIERLENQLSGLVPEPDLPAIAELETQRRQTLRAIEALAREFDQQLARELAWGPVLTGEAFAAKLRRPWVEWRAKSQRPQWDVLAALEDALESRNRIQGQLLRRSLHERRTALVRERRRELKTLVRALRARKGSRRLDHFSTVDLDAVLHAFPVWLAPLSTLHHALPLRREIFDLTILDEATQSDMASALPLLHRSHRSLLIGDFKQLRHVSFLSRTRQGALAQNAGLDDNDIHRLDYRDRSILDLADDAVASQDAVITLNEHFRSMPPIIAFSNERFYANGLRVMTQRPQPTRESLALIRTTGKRAGDGGNIAEVERVVAELNAVTESQAQLSDAACHSIGVLSPFRRQVELLREAIGGALPLQVQARHRIRVNTAHGFQGEERDVMFLSWVVDEDAPPGSFTFLRRADVVNVAITRARLRQISLTSIAADSPRLPELVRAYLTSISRRPGSLAAGKDAEDPFVRAIRRELETLGAQSFVAHPIAGMEIDLVATCGDRVVGLDLVGYPGPFAERFSLERFRVFYRAGLPIVPIAYSVWRTEPDRVRDKLAELLQ